MDKQKIGGLAGFVAAVVVVVAVACMMGAQKQDKKAFAQLVITCGEKMDVMAISQDISLGNGLAGVRYKGDNIAISKPADCWMVVLPSNVTEERLSLGFLPKPKETK